MILRSTTAHTNAIQWNSDQKLPFGDYQILRYTSHS
nr:MAG TPA: hypothetical protein [Caudoviricetes sp.]DAP06129.1 MAG TPA: hypothetical protein [Caudoviricetes sp.]